YYLGYRNWLRQKRKEITYGVEQARFQSKLEACKAVWSLLEYISEKEHPNTIFVARGDKENKFYVVRRKQAEDFLNALPEVFFRKGYGVLMPSEVQNRLFELRSIVYRFLEAAKRAGETGEEIRVKNEEIIPAISKEREWLIKKLREEIKTNPDV
ncbi:MAG: CRISPR-associated protein Csx28, partial [Bacteroidota bacterium]